MNSDGTTTPVTPMTLAMRREILIAQCAIQRAELYEDGMAVRASFQPLGMMRSLGSFSKLPLMVAGIVAGLVVTGPSRAVALLETASSVWAMARSAMLIVRSIHDKHEHAPD